MKVLKILPRLGTCGAMAAGAIFAGALQAGTVTLRISGVQSASGNVVASHLGGTPEANAAAWADNWPRTLEFLRTQLQVTSR